MKIYFVQPKNFNRTEKRTNPFFDPIIEVCEENGIEYLIYNPGRKSRTGYSRKKVRDSRHLRRFVSFFSKYFGRFIPGGAEYDIDRMAGRIWNLLTFGRDRADIYITVADELYGALPGLNPKARVVDIMHGIIYPGHEKYLAPEGGPSEYMLSCSEREAWVTGVGYREFFIKAQKNEEWVKKHVAVIGDVYGHLTMDKPCDSERKHLFIGLQVNNGSTDEDNAMRLEKVLVFMRTVAPLGEWNGQPVIIKHHPRYDGRYDITPLKREFPRACFVDDSLRKIAEYSVVHVTIDSTTAFDVAAFGVPTFFIGSDAPQAHPDLAYACDIWNCSFKYPYWGWPFEKLIELIKEDSRQVSKVLYAWFEKFYSPIDKNAILKGIQGC